MPMRVLVTGASGRIGKLVVRKLLQNGRTFAVRALVRDPERAANLRQYMDSQANTTPELSWWEVGLEIVYGDVTMLETLSGVFDKIDSVIIATSAKPLIDTASLVGVVALRLASLGNLTFKPTFWFDDNQTPERIDWRGQLNQFNLARAAGVQHIILVSHMGGTMPDHFLNANMDHIILWKRLSEQYLIASGIPYTIIHPGGLFPHFCGLESAAGGRRQLYVGIDDTIMAASPSIDVVPHEDIAEVCVQSLSEPSALNRSFDLGSGPEGEGDVYNGKLAQLLAILEGRNCTYKCRPQLKSCLKTPMQMACCSSIESEDNSDAIDANIPICSI